MKGLPRFLLALALVMTCLLPALAQEANLAARPGVVRITATAPDPRLPDEIGTGFVIRIDRGVAYVLTAAHVVEGRRASVQFFPGTGQGLRASVVGLEGGNPQGLALLRVDGAIPREARALPLAGEVELEGGEAVVAIGHPTGAGDWSLVSGTVAARVGRVLRVQIPVRKRNSGGPLLMQGRVVALVLNEIDGFGEALPIRDAVSFARGYRVQPEAAPLPSPGAAPLPLEAAQHAPAPAPARQLRIAGPKPLYEPYRTGDIFQECAHCPEMVVIVPDREFTIGSPRDEKGRNADEGPFGPIRFAAPYAIGRFEVTRAQFARSGVAAARGCQQWTGSEWKLHAGADWRDPKFPDGFRQGDEHPVVCVNREEARAYVKWLNAQRPVGAVGAYRLPSEAEWEFAARGNTTSARFWGDNPDDACKYANVADRTAKARFKTWTIHECDDGHLFTAPAGGGQAGGGYRFRPNAFGLYDMLGNASEWTEDCYQANFDAKISDGSAFDGWPTTSGCDRGVLRGGSWGGSGSRKPDLVRSAFRGRSDPGGRYLGAGFRVARTLP